MANDIYIITPTDGNLSREFNVSPYSTNGTVSPTSSVLDSSAVAVNTSLLFHGKGSDEYGERFQENFYHLLENFSGYTEPQSPVQGQMWFDNSDNTLKIFEVPSLDVFDIDGGSLVIKLNGNPDSRYFQMVKDAIKLRFSSGFKFNIYTSDSHDTKDPYTVLDTYIADSCVDTPITYSVPVTIGDPGASDIRRFLSLTLNSLVNIDLPSTPGTTPIQSQIGLWIPVYKTSTDILETALGSTITQSDSNIYAQIDDLNVAENRIINVADPIDLLDAVNKQFTAAQYLPLSGGTIAFLNITGNLSVTGTSIFNNDITVTNSSIIDLSNNSPIINLVDPSAPLDAMNLQYANNNYLNKLVADTVSGILTLSAQPGQNGDTNPLNDYHASTVGYVNDTVSALAGGPTTLGGLLDVTINVPLINQILEYNGSQWINVPNTGGSVNPGDFVSITSGGTISAAGILKLDGQPGQNGTIGATVVNDSATVGYVDITISDHFTALLPNGDVHVISGSYDINTDTLSLQRNGGQTDVLINGILSSNTSLLVPHDIIPSNNGDLLESIYAINPTWPTINVSNGLSEISKSLKSAQKRNLSIIFNSDGRSAPYDLTVIDNVVYTGGFNSLQVFINGQKQIANTRSHLDLSRSIFPDIYHSVSTGLSNDLTSYSFNISIDGAANQLITAIGQNVQLYALLKEVINSQLLGARCVLHEGILSFITDLSGNTSNIVISDINLFSSLSGTPTFDPVIIGTNYDYSEIGQYGNINNSQIQFNTILAAGSTIEFVILTVGGASDNFGYEL